MAQITARQAVRGTKVRVSGSMLNPIGSGSVEIFSWVTVDHWEGHGNGFASLIDTRGQARGQYTADELLDTI